MNSSKVRSLNAKLLPALAALALAAPAQAELDLSGVWILYRAEGFGTPALTEKGEAFKSSYNFKKDDPALLCIPASWTRIYSNPNTPFEILQSDGSVTFNYELFDVVRTVPVVSQQGPFDYQKNNPDLPTLGESVAWYSGDQLFIHSKNYGTESRVLSTIRGWAGMPQSPLLVTLERYWLEDGALRLEITHFDPLMYSEPLVVTYPFDLEEEFEVEPYGCDPEAASLLTISDDSDE
jgi:hypothetical protein